MSDIFSKNDSEEEKKAFQKFFDAEMMRADENAIKETAKTLFIFYESLKNVGFSQQEAFTLLLATMTSVKPKG